MVNYIDQCWLSIKTRNWIDFTLCVRKNHRLYLKVHLAENSMTSFSLVFLLFALGEKYNRTKNTRLIDKQSTHLQNKKGKVSLMSTFVSPYQIRRDGSKDPRKQRSIVFLRWVKLLWMQWSTENFKQSKQCLYIWKFTKIVSIVWCWQTTWYFRDEGLHLPLLLSFSIIMDRRIWQKSKWCVR